jgi:5'-nucleotidase
MHILISNDDGVNALGVSSLAESLSGLAKITVLAPDRDRSAVSNSLTIDSPLRITKQSNGYYGLNGTPTDCVHIAVTGWENHHFDMVVSGINFGANLGEDVIYSGTVAAAIEGRHLGYPALAISLATNNHESKNFSTASIVAKYLVRNLIQGTISSDTILNVNVPDLPISQIKGIQTCRLGRRHKADPVIQAKDPRGLDIYWVGPVGGERDAGIGTDFHAISNGYVSVTPIKTDMTDYNGLADLKTWSDSLIISPEMAEVI